MPVRRTARGRATHEARETLHLYRSHIDALTEAAGGLAMERVKWGVKTLGPKAQLNQGSEDLPREEHVIEVLVRSGMSETYARIFGGALIEITKLEQAAVQQDASSSVPDETVTPVMALPARPSRSMEPSLSPALPRMIAQASAHHL